MNMLAFRIAEEVSLPVMVCMDGFVLTHAMERIDLPEQEAVDKFLPSFVPRQILDPSDPMSIGAMVGPEAFTEVRYLGHVKQLQALELIPGIANEFEEIFGRRAAGEHDADGLVTTYRIEGAQVVMVALGSVIGTMKDVVDEMREAGSKVGVLGITSFRPFPLDAVRNALAHIPKVVVVERAFAPGIGGIVSSNVRTALSNIPVSIATAVAGLGGRPITRDSIRRVIERAFDDTLPELTFVDLDVDLINRELERHREQRRSGPMAENLLRDLGSR